jgi:hypothetical protein
MEWLDGKTPRQLMQTLGTEWGRELVHDNLWVKLAQRRIEQHRAASTKPLVFDDCRFDNEAQLIRGLGGIVVNLYRPEAVGATMSHKSEAGVHPCLVNLTILNAGEGRDEFQRLVLSSLDGR